MEKCVITELTRNSFKELLEKNPGLIIIKFGATWCGPCKKIETPVHNFFASSPHDVLCADIDVDTNFDFYAFMKSKKMCNGVPTILCYKKGNTTIAPTDGISGQNLQELDAFFKRCRLHLQSVQAPSR
jgi:thioredoxin-like negative regulator of GroEL